MDIKKYFIIRPTNEENNEFVITVGKHLATERRFTTKEDAEEYINTPCWETIIALVAEMIEINDEMKMESKQ